MKPLKELYKILLDSGLIEQHCSICLAINFLVYHEFVEEEERRLLIKHFVKLKPGIFSRWWWHPTFRRVGGYNYWWTRNSRGNRQRIKFIKSIIRSL